jgi:hypothetical protein
VLRGFRGVRTRTTVGATAALVGALALHGHAQPTQPVYLQYDGFVRNKDNHTLTLSFGYYNMNHVDVRIAVGEANGFLPGPPDRNQPLAFLEGRHRFACVIVVPENFDGRLQWQVKFAGRTATTTDKVLNSLYELEPNSEKRVMAGLDLRTAPKGSCVNRSPIVQIVAPGNEPGTAAEAIPTLLAQVGAPLNLNGDVQDDGLPRDGKLVVSWKKTSGPGSVTFSTTDTASTRATFGSLGDYELELVANDGEKSSSTKVKVAVRAAMPTGG